MRYALALLVACVATQGAADDLILVELSGGQTIAVRMSEGSVEVLGVFETITVIKATPVNPPVNPPKVTRATYVYEKDSNPVPPEVAAELQRLNADADSSVVATEFEEDTKNGLGETPTQYVQALKAAKAEGLPCLVIEQADGTIKVVSDPRTKADVLEALE